MTTLTPEPSPLFRARLAGFLYLIANVPAPFALIYLPARFIVRGDAAATAHNIMASESLFRLGIVAHLFNLIANLLLVLALYQLLKVVSKRIAALMVMFVLAAVPIGMLNELNQIAVLQLLSGTDYLNVFTTEQLQSLAYQFIRLHSQGISIMMIFWGLWLFPMGYLIFKSNFMPRIIGILLMIACMGYVIESFAAVLGYNVSLIFFTGWGEMVLMLWLLIKGVNAEQWQQRAATPQSI